MQTFYLSIIVKELGLLHSADCSPTYEKSDQSVSEIVDSHLQYLDKFELPSNDKYKNVPRIYAIPKLHKNCSIL